MANINASIEVSPKQAAESSAIVDLFPPGGRVYITDVGTDSTCLLYTSPSPRDVEESRMPSSA